jgi:Protein of unknown function (DUF2806)
MPEGTSNSLVNLGELSKPADTLIKKVSKAVGGIFAPHQVKRLARAEAEAALAKAQSEIEITALQQRAFHRFVEEEARHQQNIEDITAKALPQLDSDSEPDTIDDDWIANFFDKSRIVSNDEMQQIWSRILAGEANDPGSFTKRTVNFLADLDQSDADMFSQLCRFGWLIGNLVPIVFDHSDAVYEEHGVTFGSLIHLESIGLIQFNNLTSFTRIGLPKKFSITYHGLPLLLELDDSPKPVLEVGHVVFTKVGQELAKISTGQPVDGFVDYVVEN